MFYDPLFPASLLHLPYGYSLEFMEDDDDWQGVHRYELAIARGVEIH